MAYQSEIEKLEQRYHENPQQWFAALADSYRKAGDLELALEVVRGGLEKRPNYASGHIVLGRCLVDQELYSEAAGAFEQVLELDAENIIALKSLGEIAEKQGDLPSAKAWLSKLLDIDPMNEEAREGIERLGEAERAAPAGAEPVSTAAAAPSIEPGAAWAAEALATMDRGEGSGGSAAGDSGVGGESSVDITPVQPEVLEPPPSEPEPGIGAGQELALERSSWDDAHGAAALGLSGADVPGFEKFEAGAGSAESLAAEPVAGFEATAQPGAPEGPVDHAAGESGKAGLGDESAPRDSGEMRLAGDLRVVAFNEELSWGTGEPLSAAASGNGIKEAEDRHEDLAEPVAFLGDPEAYAAREAGEPEGAGQAEPAAAPPDAAEESERAAAAGEPESDEYIVAGISTESGVTSPEWEPPSAAEQAAFERASAGEEPADLPLIMPDEGGAGPEHLSIGADEMEPVVTETMAEVYARQGLYDQARGTYERLLQQRPGDPVLVEKLASLSQRMDSRRTAAASRYSVAATGGVSAVDYLRRIFHAGAAPTGASEESPPAETAVPETTESSVLESAFGAEPDEPPGSPTIPASDEVSLSSVFGGERPSRERQPQGKGGRSFEQRDAVSFDEFYGTATEPEPESVGEESEPTGEEGDDEFRNWLEGLKT
jgi:tetratricopeptide (TPR) repeat protein